MLKYRKQLNDFIHATHFCIISCPWTSGVTIKRKDRASWNAIRAVQSSNSYRNVRHLRTIDLFSKETYTTIDDVILERNTKIDVQKYRTYFSNCEQFNFLLETFDFSFSNNFFFFFLKREEYLNLIFFFLSLNSFDSNRLERIQFCANFFQNLQFTKH